MSVEKAVRSFKRGCSLKDDVYFDLREAIRRHHQELDMSTAVFHETSSLFVISTHDGYVIKILRMDMYPVCWFNGYFTIPSWEFMLCDLIKECTDYHEFQYMIPLGIELTYGHGLTFGWDHGHGHEFNFFYPADYQEEHLISGPVQVLEEALGCIRQIRKHGQDLLFQKKKEMTYSLYQELMEKALHPHRVEQWITAGMDL